MVDTLIPVASAFSICTGLLVEGVQFVDIAPFVRFTAAGKAERDAGQLDIAEFLEVQFTGTLVDDVTDGAGTGVELLAARPATDDIDVLGDGGISGIHIVLCFGAEKVYFRQAVEIPVGIAARLGATMSVGTGDVGFSHRVVQPQFVVGDIEPAADGIGAEQLTFVVV